MAHVVKCKVCGIQFDRDKEEAVAVGGRRYAHASCAEGYEPSQDEIDLAKLHAYLKTLFKNGYNYPILNKQIDTYVKENGYSYNGILKSLIYWYEIKGEDVEKAHNRIGIVPHIYEDAKNYYYDLFLKNQLNEGKNLAEYKNPEVVEVRIKPPSKDNYHFRLFNLDD